MNIPEYPEFAPLDLSMRLVLHPRLSMLKDGISEFTFAGLYLFRHTYKYRISWLPNQTAVISGEKEGKKFFMLPCGLPEDKELFDDLFQSHDYLKNLSEGDTNAGRIQLEQWGYRVEEDRDNFDYLYRREDLATLAGRQYHKKRNLVNAFLNNYRYEEKPMRKNHIQDAFFILEEWKKSKNEEGDYPAAREALELMDVLNLKGYLYYVEDKPAAYTLGEALSRGRSFAVHFEKAIEHYKGIYQFVNKAFAAALPKYILYINREQDLGDPGLRQAKMTYRPCGFVKKYRVYKQEA
ncbi:MAG: phosphatidylglycerol lysyltransferase domain-containing protein [Spirochaetales bacterium]